MWYACQRASLLSKFFFTFILNYIHLDVSPFFILLTLQFYLDVNCYKSTCQHYSRAMQNQLSLIRHKTRDSSYLFQKSAYSKHGGHPDIIKTHGHTTEIRIKKIAETWRIFYIYLPLKKKKFDIPTTLVWTQRKFLGRHVATTFVVNLAFLRGRMAANFFFSFHFL